MDSITAQLIDPIFWFVPVFVGLVVGVLAALAYDVMKRLVERYSTRHQELIKEMAEIVENEAEMCATNPMYFSANNAATDNYRALFTTHIAVASFFLLSSLIATVGIALLWQIQNPSTISNTLSLDIISFAKQAIQNRSRVLERPVGAVFWLHTLVGIWMFVGLRFSFLAYRCNKKADFHWKVAMHTKEILMKRSQRAEQATELAHNPSGLY